MTARRAGWAVMAFLAVGVALYAGTVLLVPTFGPAFIQERRAAMPWAVIAHLAGGTIAMALGPWQFSTRLRQRAINVHRWMGRTYITAVLVGGTGALLMAPGTMFGMITHFGFGLLAVAWLFATGMAYRAIKAGNTSEHRRWMTRSFALTLAAVTLRIYLPLTQIAGIPFAPAYQAISWLCWVPNLFFAQWLLRPKLGAALADTDAIRVRPRTNA